MNFHDQRAAALRVPCPIAGCHAPAGDPCANLQTRQPLEYRPAHEARLWDAGLGSDGERADSTPPRAEW